MRAPNTPEKFWQRVDKSSACWEWTGYKDKGGYGYLYFRGVRMLAHRVAFMLFHGALPNKLLICHSCDNPSCCNPHHLFAGTQADNMKDMTQKGRRLGKLSGEKHPFAKLSWDSVSEIRNNRLTGMRHKDNAEKFGVHETIISRICSGEIWNERYKP